MSRPALLALLPLTLSPLCAAAQDLNVDFSNDGTAPPAIFAAAGSAGVWNAAHPLTFGPPVPLVDVNGAATGVAVQNIFLNVAFSPLSDPTITGDAATLLLGGWTTTDIPGRMRFSGLQQGSYDVFAYGLVPSQPTFGTSFITLPGAGSCGGPFTGSFTEGVTHVHSRLTVNPGQNVDVDWTVGGPFGSFAIFSGIQIEQIWKSVGSGISGSAGVPTLQALGTLEPTTTVQVRAIDTAPSAPAWLVFGASQLGLPLFGGTLVPSPDLVVPLTSSASGQVLFSQGWPAAVPAGLSTFWQCWILDGGAVQGVAATGGLTAISG